MGDNRCCYSKPIAMSIMKSVEQKRETLSFPHARAIIHAVLTADNFAICI